jgi:hypothetical protein
MKKFFMNGERIEEELFWKNFEDDANTIAEETFEEYLYSIGETLDDVLYNDLYYLELKNHSSITLDNCKDELETCDFVIINGNEYFVE